jgi:serine/threonine-protein kinase HipA
LEHDVDEMEALMLCPTDGVGNIAIGELSNERNRVLSIDEFLGILAKLESGKTAANNLETQILDAIQNGTSLGGTKPKLSISRQGEHYLAKFPEPGDSPWLPHVECAMLKLAALVGIRACESEVWHLPDARRSALLVKRFDRVASPSGVCRKGFISAHALLRLDLTPPVPSEVLNFGTRGFSPSTLRKSYVSFAAEMQKWCGSQEAHLAARQELWRRIVFNGLIKNADDHSKNHGLLCDDMQHQHWQLSPAFDLVAHPYAPEHTALAMAYRYVPAPRRGPQAPPRVVTRVDSQDLIAAACEHYGYGEVEARDFLRFAGGTVTNTWRDLMATEGIPESEIERYRGAFSFAEKLDAATAK